MKSFFSLKKIFKQDILPIKCSLEQTLCPTPRGRSSSIVEPYYCRSKHGLSIHVWLCIFPHFIPFSSYPIVEKKMVLSHFEEGLTYTSSWLCDIHFLEKSFANFTFTAFGRQTYRQRCTFISSIQLSR